MSGNILTYALLVAKPDSGFIGGQAPSKIQLSIMRCGAFFLCLCQHLRCHIPLSLNSYGWQQVATIDGVTGLTDEAAMLTVGQIVA